MMAGSCKDVMDKLWFKNLMRSAVCTMNFVAWYLIQYELIEYWKNPMDKYIVKFIISSLAVMLFLSYWTAVLRSKPVIPE